MDFVNGNRLFQPVTRSPSRHPLAVVPLILEVNYDRGRLRRPFSLERIGICLELPIPHVPGANEVFVRCARSEIRDEYLPHPRITKTHRMAPRVPMVEIAYHADDFCVGRPYSES